MSLRRAEFAQPRISDSGLNCNRIFEGIAVHSVGTNNKTRNVLYVRRRNHLCRLQGMGVAYSECVFVVLSYPDCNVHAPYCHLWPARPYHPRVFPRYHI